MKFNQHFLFIKSRERRKKMLQFIIGLFLGANLSLFFYSCILIGKKSNE